MATAPTSYIWSQWQDTGTSTTSCDYYTDHTWDNWSSTTASCSTGPTTSNVVWIKWNQPVEYHGDVHITVSNGSDEAVWEGWIDQYDYDSVETYRGKVADTFREVYHEVKKITPPTAEQLRAQKAQQEIRRLWNKIIADEQRKEREAAENVALELLLELVSEEEFKRYKETGRLFVKGRHYDYVIKKDGGVYRIAKDKVIDFAKKKEAEGKFICVHPKNRYKYPDTDNVIALKMWIENKENAFLRIGNKHHTTTKIKDFDKVVGM